VNAAGEAVQIATTEPCDDARMKWILAVLALAAVACSSPTVAGPPVTSTCQGDADCELVNGLPPRCCSRCEPSAMTKSAAAAARATCAATAKDQPDYFSRCPHLSCPCTRSTARCKASACVVETGPCG